MQKIKKLGLVNGEQIKYVLNCARDYAYIHETIKDTAKDGDLPKLIETK